jgi:hypothetical protein
MKFGGDLSVEFVLYDRWDGHRDLLCHVGIDVACRACWEMIAKQDSLRRIKTVFWLESSFWELVKDLRKQFKFMGEMGCYYWMYVVGEDVPDHEQFEAERSPRK